MKLLVNITKGEANLQGILFQHFRELGAMGKVTYHSLEVSELIALAKRQSCDAIIVSNPNTISKIVPGSKVNQNDWRGSVLNTSIPILIINPLMHIHSKPEGQWVLSQDIKKLKHMGKKFLYDYDICHTGDQLESAIAYLEKFPLLVLDIETTLLNQISSIAFTPISNDLSLGKTYTIPLLPSPYFDDARESLTIAWTGVRKLLSNSAAKAIHNGCFDAFHLLRYHCPIVNWYFDTEYLWHCWEAELPKALAKVCSYLLPDYYYWKHEAELSPLEYNAKDTINTARILVHMFHNAPKWAWSNYAKNFPIAIPAIKCQFEGILIDKEKHEELKGAAYSKLEKLEEQLRLSTGIPNFNPRSHKQVSTFFYKVLRASKPSRAKSDSATGETELKKVATQNPLYSYFVNLILKIREEYKAISTYYEARLSNNSRLLYSLNPDGTETERMSCTSSTIYAPFGAKSKVKSNAKNLGTQVQNLPPYYKKCCRADPGYKFIEVDKEQAEARCTSYLSGDTKLIEALETPGRDFYCYTGYLFFSIEFAKGDPLRQVVKKIIHGTNYMMGALTFIDSVNTEGDKPNQILEYRKLVGLTGMPVKEFAAHLLSLYHDAYPGVEEWWGNIKKEILLTGKIHTPDGWVRRVHGNPMKFQGILRSIVAHCSQHFSVRGINEAFWRSYYELEIPTNGEFRLKGQIHDSIIAQAIEDKAEEYEEKLKMIMDIPQPTPNGVLRIPLDSKISTYWKE